MATTARLAEGVQAIWVIIKEQGATTSAIVPREAMEKCWDIGPDQGDLLRTFAAHQEEIERAVRHQAAAAQLRGHVFLVKDLNSVPGPRQIRRP